jgi:hypothetical protein
MDLKLLLDYVLISKSFLNRFHDTRLIVKCIDQEKSYKVHRLILIQVSKFFEKFFERESYLAIRDQLFESTIEVPFTSDVMGICIELFYGSCFSNLDLTLNIEILMAVNYFQLRQETIDLCVVVNIVNIAEIKYSDDLVRTKTIMKSFYDLLDEYDLFPLKKKENIQHRILHLCDIKDIVPKFTDEFVYNENQLIATCYIGDINESKKMELEHRDMIFTLYVRTFHSSTFMKYDDLFIGITSRPKDEKEESTFEEYLSIIEKRKNGKENIIYAKGKIRIFNGFEDPMEWELLNIQLYSDLNKRNELIFPSAPTYSLHSRDEYGNFVNRNFINRMTKFKITIDFFS